MSYVGTSKVVLLLTAIVIAPSAVAQIEQEEEMTMPPAPNVQIKTDSADAFLNSLALKFGTSTKRLRSLLAKLPPKGKGLNPIEIKVIAGKLHLNAHDKEIFRSKTKSGGTGFNAQDIAAMSTQLGLTMDETIRLSQQLGLPTPAIATPTITTPPSVGSTGSSL